MLNWLSWFRWVTLMIALGAASCYGYRATPWSCMDATVTAYWVGAVGSVGAIFSALWLATAETRRRRSEDLSKARLTAIHIHMDLLSMEATAYGVQENLKEIQVFYEKKQKFPGQNIENFSDFGDQLQSIKFFPSSDLVPLVPLQGNCADKIALGQGLISATGRILRDTIVTPMDHAKLLEHILSNLAVLNKALDAIKQARAVVMEQATPVMHPTKE